MRKFEVGKEYEPYQREFDHVTVIKRTDKTIWVKKDDVTWMMRIKHDANGNEWVAESTVPYKWRDAFTYMA